MHRRVKPTYLPLSLPSHRLYCLDLRCLRFAPRNQALGTYVCEGLAFRSVPRFQLAFSIFVV